MNRLQFRLPDKVLDAPHGLTQVGELEDTVGARGDAFDLEEPPGMGKVVLDLADEVAEFAFPVRPLGRWRRQPVCPGGPTAKPW